MLKTHANYPIPQAHQAPVDENASHEFNQASIKKLIAEKEAAGWKFIFLGANIDSAAVGGSMGIAAMDCANYAVGNEKALYSAMANSSLRYATANRSFGVGSHEARVSATFTLEERSSLVDGGRPAAPPAFRPPTPNPAKPTDPGAKPDARGKRTDWKIRGEVSGS